MPLQLDLLTFYSCCSRLTYDVYKRECPPCVVDDAIRRWGNAFLDHPPIPGWSSDWKVFTLIGDWIPLRSIWPMQDRSFMAEASIHEVRNRLFIFGDVIPILYDKENHARIVFRSGERVIYCHSTTLAEGSDEDSPYPCILGLLPISYSDFVASDSAIILSHVNNFDSQRSLDSRDPQASYQWRVLQANIIQSALSAATSISKDPDEKTLDEWTEEDWSVVMEKFMRDYYRF